MSDNDLRHAHLQWVSESAFLGGAPGGPAITIDGDGVRGISPMVALLLGAGGCSGLDVVAILKKKQVRLRHFSVEVTGRRNPDYPKRYNELTLVFRLAGEGLTQEKAQRAVDLSVEKYCSVIHSLDPDIPVRTEIIIETE